MKNASRIASLMGTWTAQTHLKTNVGAYELMAYFVIHFMPDPMRGYSCSLENCSEIENQVCTLNDGDDATNSFQVGHCQNITDNVIPWSDVVAFMYFGAKVDAGFPFNKHRQEDTGGWVGPFNIIMSQNTTVLTPIKRKMRVHDEHSENVVDQYCTRYIHSPTTNYLSMPRNCTLVRRDDFVKLLGTVAVDETTKIQSNFHDSSVIDDTDPFEPYLGTCQNGDVKPILPLFRFDFAANQNGEETVHVNLKYKLLTVPRPKDFIYDLYPYVQKRFNAAHLGFHISGPYCYGNDPKRGYTFDMNLDTRSPMEMLQVSHGCIENLPCIPPAAELYNLFKGTKPEIVPAKTNIVDLSLTLLLIFATFFLLALSIVLWVVNNRLRRKVDRLRHAIGQPNITVAVDQNEAMPRLYELHSSQHESESADEALDEASSPLLGHQKCED